MEAELARVRKLACEAIWRAAGLNTRVVAAEARAKELEAGPLRSAPQPISAEKLWAGAAEARAHELEVRQTSITCSGMIWSVWTLLNGLAIMALATPSIVAWCCRRRRWWGSWSLLVILIIVICAAVANILGGIVALK